MYPLQPKAYTGKNWVASKLPSFDIDRIEQVAGCGLFIMPYRVVYALNLCIEPLWWPTRWQETERGEDIYEFLQEVRMALLPVDCTLGVDLSELNQNLSNLTNAVLALSQSQGTGGECDMCKCNCCCGGGGTTTTMPPISTPEPTTSNEPVPNNNWCKACTFMVDQYEESLQQIFGGLAGGTAILLVVLAGITAGVYAVGAAMLAFIGEISVASWAGTQIVEPIYSNFLTLKDDLKCHLFNSPLKTPTGMKQAALQWLSDNYVDGLPAYLLMYAVMQIQKYDRILTAEIDAVDADCTDCGDTGDGEPPNIPAGYELVPVNVIFHEVQSGNYGLSHSEVDNVMTLAYDMTANGEFLFVNYNIEGIWELSSTAGYVGILWYCTSYTRSASPLGTGETKIQNSPLNGIIRPNRGVAQLYSNGLPDLVSEVSTYLASQGYDIVDNTTWGMDNDHVFGSQFGTEVHGSYPTNSVPLRPPFVVRDKVNTGGQGGRVTMTIEFYYLRQLT